MRKIDFQNDQFYHVYNRGVDKRDIFLDANDYLRFLLSLREFNDKRKTISLRTRDERKKRVSSGPTAGAPAVGPLETARIENTEKLVDIIAYCLNPNHYHLLLKQKTEGGISEFMKRLGGYTWYFNARHDRSGSLFQGKYKFRKIDKDGDLIYVSAYINGNPEIHGYSKADKWPYSSCLDYLGRRNGTLCDKIEIFKYFKNGNAYVEELKHVIGKSKEIKEELRVMLLE